MIMTPTYTPHSICIRPPPSIAHLSYARLTFTHCYIVHHGPFNDGPVFLLFVRIYVRLLEINYHHMRHVYNNQVQV